jgi:hypothetical protein
MLGPKSVATGPCMEINLIDVLRDIRKRPKNTMVLKLDISSGTSTARLSCFFLTFYSYLEQNKKMSADDISIMLSKEYPSVEVFKDFFNWYKSAGQGFLHPGGEPTTTTCLNTFHSILGYIKNETGKSMSQAQCDDIHTFIKYHLGVQDIKKPKYVADSYVIEQVIRYWWSHDHAGYNPISFPLVLLWLTYLVARPGSILFTPEYQNGLRYKV